jgi:hypothetical protein
MRNHSVMFLIFLTAGSVYAAGVGTSGGDLLKTPPGVRPSALAGTYASMGDDIYVIGFNPAGLSRVAKFSVGLDHVQGFGGIQTEALSVAIPTRKIGLVGAQLQFRHMSDIKNELAQDPPVRSADFLLTLATARHWGRWSAGVAFKTLYSTLAEKSGLANAFDLGGGFLWRGFQFSAVVQNFGTALKYQPNAQEKDPLPLTFRLGVARTFFAKRQSVLLGAIEADHVRDEGFQQSVGLEYWHRTLIALRFGFRHGEMESLATGFSMGAAIRNGIGKVEYEVGYAWKPSRVDSGYTLNNHLFGLLVWY